MGSGNVYLKHTHTLSTFVAFLILWLTTATHDTSLDSLPSVAINNTPVDSLPVVATGNGSRSLLERLLVTTPAQGFCSLERQCL